MNQVQAAITHREQRGGSLHMQLENAQLASQLHPGQAILLRTAPGYDPFLRRTYYPIALGEQAFVLRIPPGSDRGDAWLRILPEGSLLDCLGPVGQGFVLSPGCRRLLCVGMGEHAWPLLPLVWQAVQQQIAVTFIVIASSPRQTPAPQHLPVSAEYRRLAPDPRLGWPPALDELIAWADQIAAAAPRAHYRALATCIQEQRIVLPPDYAHVLVQTDFLCGRGACQACATDIAGGRRRVCLRGPVFDIRDVIR